jgi:hypothetical protein
LPLDVVGSKGIELDVPCPFFEQAVTQILSQPAAAPLVQQPSVQKASVAEPDDYGGRYETFDTFMS